MRVMVIVKAAADSEAGVLPSEQMLAEIGPTTTSWSKPASCLQAKGSLPERQG